MREYKVLRKQEFAVEDYRLVPIRHEDRYKIMRWRNEQIYHLRQSEPLTKKKQDAYFEDVVAKLFYQVQPNQILFSFLKEEECVGYGGLVHINWIDNNAEISFVMDTVLQEKMFENYWKAYLSLLKKVAFKNLNLRKIYTTAFDVRPKLYSALEDCGFKEECRLIEHCKIENQYKDVLIHSFWNPKINLKIRSVNQGDVDLLFEWANDSAVRDNSFNSAAISYRDHVEWFQSKLKSKNSKIFIFQDAGRSVGQVRLDKSGKWWEIDFSVDKSCRGLGLGTKMLEVLIGDCKGLQLKALVRKKNIASQKVFDKLGFNKNEDTAPVLDENHYEYFLVQ